MNRLLLVLVAVLAITLLGGSCTPSNVTPVPGPGSGGTDGGVVPEVGGSPALDACDAAEQRLQKLQCRRPDGTGLWLTPTGTSFSEACRYAASDGRFWPTRCISNAATCKDAVQCH
jgi:hypothetical protein